MKSLSKSFRSALHQLPSDPYALARLFASLPNVSPNKQPQEPVPLSEQSLQVNGLDWSVVMTSFMNAWTAAEAGYAINCYDHQATMHAAFNQVLANSTGNLLLPALHVVCRNTKRIAIQADASSGQSSEHTKLQNAVTVLQESFSRTFNDRTPLPEDQHQNRANQYHESGSKKIGVLAIVNELFSIYFRLNTLRLCRNLVRPIESRKLHEYGSPYSSVRVQYYYYSGRLALLEDQYATAETNLSHALEFCLVTTPEGRRNKRRILRYLLPVQLYRGRLPSDQILRKYNLVEFVSLTEALRTGNLRQFHDALLEYQHRFIRQGTYLLLEKCKAVCYRNLFKRIHLVLDRHQIHLNQVVHAFKWLGMPIDLDEAECILANLIFRGFVRGYLSHTKRILVLSKRDPFPVSSVVS